MDWLAEFYLLGRHVQAMSAARQAGNETVCDQAIPMGQMIGQQIRAVGHENV